MNKETLSKFIFPIILLVIGIGILVAAASTGQDTGVYIGSITLIIAGIISLLYSLEVISMLLQKILFVFTLIVAVGVAIMNYNVIEEKINFEKEVKKRQAVVVERLKLIRAAEIGFKDEKGRYAANFDELIKFYETDSVTVIRAEGTLPDTIATEAEAIALNLPGFVRDTSRVPAMQKVFPNGIDIKEIQFIPFSDNQKFKLDAGQVERNSVQVPVFEAFAKFEYIYTGLETKNYNINLEEGLRVGSMTEPTTSGNWE